jgi:predicted  nucleic acid-binding Zn-ribbon protein
MTPTPRTEAFIGKSFRDREHELTELYTFTMDFERDIHELNERLIDRQETLMAALIENQNLRRELDKAMHYNQ